jgi:hypothetical protein
MWLSGDFAGKPAEVSSPMRTGTWPCWAPAPATRPTWRRSKQCWPSDRNWRTTACCSGHPDTRSSPITCCAC